MKQKAQSLCTCPHPRPTGVIPLFAKANYNISKFQDISLFPATKASLFLPRTTHKIFRATEIFLKKSGHVASTSVALLNRSASIR